MPEICIRFWSIEMPCTVTWARVGPVRHARRRTLCAHSLVALCTRLAAANLGRRDGINIERRRVLGREKGHILGASCDGRVDLRREGLPDAIPPWIF